jgi:hypothetical protein
MATYGVEPQAHVSVLSEASGHLRARLSFRRTEYCLGPRVTMQDTEYGLKDNLVTRFIRSLVGGYQNLGGKYRLHLQGRYLYITGTY